MRSVYVNVVKKTHRKEIILVIKSQNIGFLVHIKCFITLKINNH